MNGLSFGSHSVVSFVDDISLYLPSYLKSRPALETIVSEAAYLGLEMNWQKTKVQQGR